MADVSPPTAERPSLRNLVKMARDYAFIASGFLSSLVAFPLLMTLTTLSLGTFVVWIGALLLPLTLLLASTFAELSRIRVRRWGTELPPARYEPGQPGLLRLPRRMAEPARWLDLVFETIVAFPLRTLTFFAATTWAAVALAGVTQPVWGPFVTRDDFSVGGVVLEAITGGAAPDALTHSLLIDIGFNFLVGCLFLVTLPLVLHGLAQLDAVATAAALVRVPAPGPLPTIGASATGVAVPEGTRSPAAPWWALPRENWTWIVAIFVALVSISVNWPLLAEPYRAGVVSAMLVSLGHAAALLIVVRWPAAGIAVQTVTGIASVLATADSVAWPLPWPVMSLILQVVLVLLVSLRNAWPWAITAWSVPQAAVLIATIAFGIGPDERDNLIVCSAISLGALVFGVIVRQLVTSRHALSAERRTTADLSAQRRELDERNRIAQELHDVVAHSMSVISVQATTAKYRLSDVGPEAEHEFETIATSSRQALAEMRSLLTLLRATDDDREAPLAPQPTLSDISSLVEATRQSGARITLRMPHEGDTDDPPPPATGLTAYRIVQEALSNAVRHAPGSEIDVAVVTSDEEVRVEVVNGPADEGRPQPDAPGAGLGLAGVRERATSLGGRVEARPTAAGGFRLTAVLPLR